MTTHEDELHTLSMAAPFPPAPMMYRVSGLTSEHDFAKHGRDLFSALSKASPKSLDLQTVLDFWVGSGRLAPMFKDFRGTYYRADVDHDLVDWAASAWPGSPVWRPHRANRCPAPAGSVTVSYPLFQCFLT